MPLVWADLEMTGLDLTKLSSSLSTQLARYLHSLLNLTNPFRPSLPLSADALPRTSSSRSP